MKNLSKTIQIILIKIIFLLKKLIVSVFELIKKTILFILNFLFFKIIVKIYYNYILLYKKIKEINKKNNSKLYLIKKNSSIFIIILLAFVIILRSNIKKTEAQGLSNQIYKTTLAQNIKSDFEDSEPEELIIETAEDIKLEAISSPQYIEQIGTLRAKTKIATKPSKEEINAIFSYEHGDVLTNPGLTSVESKNARDNIIEYIVQAGETISSIAQDLEINVNTILWENNLTARSLIKPGSKLIILPANGVTHIVAKNENITKIASKYGVLIESIVDSNDIDADEPLKIGQKIFIPGGKKIAEKTIVTGGTYSGTTITQNSASNANQQPAYTGGKLLWPTVGSRITQYYSWSHKGLDIANKTGTPLYAAEAGTVERAGWNNGYGYNIVINHGGGLKTLYGHSSKLHVKAGDKVNRGDIIADMGSTGWSTGPHIHFEVIVNGVKQNPLNYIK